MTRERLLTLPPVSAFFQLEAFGIKTVHQCLHFNFSPFVSAEGNVAAVKVLADHGADLTLPDRWENTVQEEAKRSNARQLLVYLKDRKKK